MVQRLSSVVSTRPLSAPPARPVSREAPPRSAAGRVGFPTGRSTGCPRTTGSKYAPADFLGARKAFGKLSKQVANGKINGLERHLVGLVVDRRPVAGKEREADDAVHRMAEHLTQNLEAAGDRRRSPAASWPSGRRPGACPLGLAPHREQERPGCVSLDHARGLAHPVAQERDRRPRSKIRWYGPSPLMVA